MPSSFDEHIPVPPEQNIHITPFDDDTALVTNEIYKSMFSDMTDSTSGLEFSNCFLPYDIDDTDNAFDTTSSGSYVIVSPGRSFINGTFIETTDYVYLDVDNTSNSYLYASSGDSANASDGSYDIYLCMLYNPTESDPDAYIGLINDYSYFTNNQQYLCLLNIITITVSSGVSSIDSFNYYNSDYSISASYPPISLDGGWLNSPPIENITYF